VTSPERLQRPALRTGTPRGRAVLAATVAGSSVAMLTSTVLNVGLPEVAVAFDASTAEVQWVVNAYLLALAALVLLGGALGDRFGRRRVFVLGTLLFAAASVASALAPTLAALLTARAATGVGAALLTPGSLAILEASFHPDDRAEAIGAWSGLGGVAAAVGPALGGALLDVAGWPVLFLLNLPVAAAAVVLALVAVPETHDEATHGTRLDLAGTATGALGLATLTFGLVRLGSATDALALGGVAAGLAVLVAFVVVERRVAAPLVPPSLFADRVFTTANLLTFVVYAALSAFFLLVTVALRLLLGLDGLAAGAGTAPVTLLMLLGSARSGRLARTHGPRAQLVVGPALLGVGALLLSRLDQGASYWTDALPGLLVFAVGLVAMVAPVTATVLAAAPEDRAGVASGVNNAVARSAGLLAVAVLPSAAGLGDDAFRDAAAFAAGYGTAMVMAAGLAFAGAVVALVGLPSGPLGVAAPRPAPPGPSGDVSAGPSPSQ